MPTREGYPQGVPCWVDLATTDLELAKSFYADLFGWSFGSEPGQAPYTTAYQRGLAAAGLADAPAGLSFSVWSTYFAVDDADATAARINRAGGTVTMEPTDMGASGRMAFASDPTGAGFGIWQAHDHFGAAIVNEHGSLNWNELVSDDLDRAIPFYVSVFGFTHDAVESNGQHVTFSVGEREIAGAVRPRDDETPNHWRIYLAVGDVEKAEHVVRAKGGAVLAGPIVVPEVGSFLAVADPTGAPFTLIQLALEID